MVDSQIISSEFVIHLKGTFHLGWEDIHGYAHWERVWENGLRLSQSTGANTIVVELFAFLHDVKRYNNSIDPFHGKRAAEFAETLPYVKSLLSPEEVELLKYACAHHTMGWVDADITIQTCWDADRLDLGRCGIIPNPKRLCTPIAKQANILEWAYRRSLSPSTNQKGTS